MAGCKYEAILLFNTPSECRHAETELTEAEGRVVVARPAGGDTGRGW